MFTTTAAPEGALLSPRSLISTSAPNAERLAKTERELSVSKCIQLAGAQKRKKPMNVMTSPAAFKAKATSMRPPGDERLWSLYDKFERAYFRMQKYDTPEAMAGCLDTSTAAQIAAHKRWQRAGDAAFRAARCVMAEPALTGEGLLMKIHVAGFELDAAAGSFKMPYRGPETPSWSPGRFSAGAADFIKSIEQDLRRARRFS